MMEVMRKRRPDGTFKRWALRLQNFFHVNRHRNHILALLRAFCRHGIDFSVHNIELGVELGVLMIDFSVHIIELGVLMIDLSVHIIDLSVHGEELLQYLSACQSKTIDSKSGKAKYREIMPYIKAQLADLSSTLNALPHKGRPKLTGISRIWNASWFIQVRIFAWYAA